MRGEGTTINVLNVKNTLYILMMTNTVKIKIVHLILLEQFHQEENYVLIVVNFLTKQANALCVPIFTRLSHPQYSKAVYN